MSSPYIELREVSFFDGSEILEMIREVGPGENGFVNNSYDMEDCEFSDYILKHINDSKGIGLPPDRVPSTRYWLLINDYPVGIGNLRHYLNDNLRKHGGHIGYCIRPSERGKGYGNLILSELLKKAKEKKIPKALLTCSETNKASRSVIEYNSGKLEQVENGGCLYWIKLTEEKGLRKIHIDDYDEMLDLWLKTPGMGLSEADSRQNVLNFLDWNDGLSYCYEEDGKIIGTILCGHDGRRGYIYHVTVAENSMGKGIGRMLVDKSLEDLKAEGIDKCHLFVFADNEPGNAFWNSTGWTKRNDIFVYSRNI